MTKPPEEENRGLRRNGRAVELSDQTPLGSRSLRSGPSSDLRDAGAWRQRTAARRWAHFSKARMLRRHVAGLVLARRRDEANQWRRTMALSRARLAISALTLALVLTAMGSAATFATTPRTKLAGSI